MTDKKITDLGEHRREVMTNARCEFPNCMARDTSYAKLFKKHLCTPHRKDMLLAASWLQQITDAREKEEGSAGLMERMMKATSKSETHYAIDKKTFQELIAHLQALQKEVDQIQKDGG